jgi:hypothetical protein
VCKLPIVPATCCRFMGFFNFFKSPPPVQDPLFGPLRYIKGTKQTSGYFEGRGLFNPTGNTIEYLIDSDETGPSEAQREFYRTLQAEFTHYIVRIEPLIIDEFRNWLPDFVIHDFTQEFTLLAVTIPHLDISPVEWDLWFSTVHDLNHQITVSFQDKQPIHIHIDG